MQALESKTKFLMPRGELSGAHRAATALEVYAVGGHVTGNFGSRCGQNGCVGIPDKFTAQPQTTYR